jgi:tetrahydromethanopterin S-methyltransferase subunit G
MNTIPERVAVLEHQYGEILKRLDRLDQKLDKLDQRLESRFLWMLGIQFATLLSALGMLFAIVLRSQGTP